MIILGVVLIIIGAAILYFFRPERFAQFGGAVLVLIGVLLVLLGVLNTADVDLDTSVRTAFAALRSSWG